ncbi:MAG: hypothetical protein ACRDPD_07010, partial [Streptosporangiaceae bacterium]
AEDARAETARAREAAAHDMDQLRAGHAAALAQAAAQLRKAEERAERAAAEAREAITQTRADTARERDELRGVLEDRARVLEESRAELRGRAERAEQALAAAQADPGQLPAVGGAGVPGRARSGRAAQQPGDQAGS